MRDYLLTFMRSLEEKIPPPTGCHHALTYGQYGNDEDGWEDKLTLRLNIGGEFHNVFMDADDFDLTPSDLSDCIKLMVSK